MARCWTEYEEAWLAQVWPKTEIPAEAIAHALKRTIRAIWSKVHILRIKRPWNRSPKNMEHLKRLHETWNHSYENLEHLKQARKIAQETWLGSPEHLEHWERVRKIAQETWCGSLENLENLRRMRKKSRETWIGSPKHLAHLKRMLENWNGSPKQVEQLKQARKKIRAKPTWPEAIFYGLVYGYDRLAKEFRAQENIPTTVCNHTVDGRWRDVIFELDGGGHNVHGNMTEHDRLISIEYQTMGYRVVREGTSNELFLRFLQVTG